MDHDHASNPVSLPDPSTQHTTDNPERMSAHKRPVAQSERYASLDTLRGFALLGILVPNIWAFSGPMAAMTDPTVIGDTPANNLAHDITSTVFLGKFMFLFALLFGAGLVMYSRKFDTADDNGKYHTKLHNGWSLWYIRCAVLLVFGMIHAYLFWYGDILTFYAVSGLTLLWWVRRLNPKLQLWGGLGLYLLGALLMTGFSFLGLWALNNGHITADELSGDAAAEIKGYTGSIVDAFMVRFPTTLSFQFLFGIMFMPALWGIMTTGIGLTRLGFLTGERSTRSYILLASILIPTGLLTTYLAYQGVHTGYKENAGFVWQALSQPIGVPLAFGYAALIIAMSKSAWAKPITTPLAAVGRMALTNYFAHTLLCTTFFYGYGLGYFAKLQFPALWLVILSVWAFNIVFSMLWLRAFKMGPFEWLWRCLTYRQLVHIR